MLEEMLTELGFDSWEDFLEFTELNENICPVCEEELIHEEGCSHCLACGYSVCEM